MTVNAPARSGVLWAITSYFNPVHYRRRLANYHTFRDRLQLPLATIELSFDGSYELGAGDADLLVQLHGEDVMWQKERLLNVLLHRLPAECRQVVWLDCDIVFERQDWPERLAVELTSYCLVQPFRQVHYLPPHAGPAEASPAAATLTAPCVAVALETGRSADEVLSQSRERDPQAPVRGLAWAARRELLERHGLYDAAIIGGGDSDLACAAVHAFENVIRRHYMNEWQRERYLAWAEPFHRDVCGAVSCIDGDAFHLWHGAMEDRHLVERHKGLRPYAFNPYEDIAIADNGCWRWATDKPHLHAYVRDYFAARKEDGELRAGR